jgi:hypothetical protein
MQKINEMLTMFVAFLGARTGLILIPVTQSLSEIYKIIGTLTEFWDAVRLDGGRGEVCWGL